MTRGDTFFDVVQLKEPNLSLLKTATFVMDLLSETGKDPLKLETKRVDLTGEQYTTRFQQIVGQEAACLIDRINPELSNKGRIKKVLEALDKAGEKGRKEMRKELG